MFAIMIGVTFGMALLIHFTCKEEPLGYALQVASDVEDLKTTLEADKQDDGKYKQIDKETINGVDYLVDVYYNDVDDKHSYRIYMYKVEDYKTYMKFIDLDDTTYGWTEIADDTPSATSTPK